MKSYCTPFLAITTFVLALSLASADEGMWLFNNPPRKLLKEKYGFEPTDKWLDHLQKSSVRFNSGGSGSFVSPNGLVMTNHHVGADALQKLSSASENILKDGFHAPAYEQEKKCVDLELNVLMKIEDVTDKVKGAVKSDMSSAAAQAARRAVINTIEEEATKKTGLRCDVVTLYRGGQYHLYQFKKYTDVRLVFAPEQAIAFFGGDTDNFEYPRYCLDVCFFRVYENDKPVTTDHFLRWSKSGAKEGELTFVSGHPGRTSRLNTVAHLQFLRDKSFPLTLNVLRRREIMLNIYSDRSQENARRAMDELFGYQNSRKARLGGLAGLQDPALFEAKSKAEKALRKAVNADSELKQKYGDAWDQIEETIQNHEKIRVPHYLLERGVGFNTNLFSIARTLVRLAEEKEKPNAERLPEYSEAGMPSLKLQLFSAAPIYKDLEIAKLADSLGLMAELAGMDNDVIHKILAGKSPRARAAELVNGTKLEDVEYRKKLAEGGKSALASSGDPMIELANGVDGLARKLRKQYEETVEEPRTQAYGKIAAAQFAVYGAGTYPDATFTLRLAFGPVKGFEESGKQIPAWTTLGGTYDHGASHGFKEPWKLPPSWIEKKDRLNPDVPYNFVNTADIIGGNSGSPVVNKKGEIVGIIFDGNIQSLVLDFAFSDDVARAVSVHSSGIIEALRKVYEADNILKEIVID